LEKENRIKIYRSGGTDLRLKNNENISDVRNVNRFHYMDRRNTGKIKNFEGNMIGLTNEVKDQRT